MIGSSLSNTVSQAEHFIFYFIKKIPVIRILLQFDSCSRASTENWLLIWWYTLYIT